MLVVVVLGNFSTHGRRGIVVGGVAILVIPILVVAVLVIAVLIVAILVLRHGWLHLVGIVGGWFVQVLIAGLVLTRRRLVVAVARSNRLGLGVDLHLDAVVAGGREHLVGVNWVLRVRVVGGVLVGNSLRRRRLVSLGLVRGRLVGWLLVWLRRRRLGHVGRRRLVTWGRLRHVGVVVSRQIGWGRSTCWGSA